MYTNKQNDNSQQELIQDRAIRTETVVIDGKKYTVIALAPVGSKEHPQETVIDKLLSLLSES